MKLDICKVYFYYLFNAEIMSHTDVGSDGYCREVFVQMDNTPQGNVMVFNSFCLILCILY